MKDAFWFVLITLIGIPVGGSILTYVADRLSRTTTKETALLAAEQRRRDIEITQLQDALKDLLEAGTAVQSYTWFVDEDIRLKTTIPKAEFHKHGGLVERAVFGAQRVRAIARAMPTEKLRDSYDDVAKLIMEVVSGQRRSERNRRVARRP
jgi:hypothetical protein